MIETEQPYYDSKENLMENNFVIDYLLGKCETSDIERYIGRWNNGNKDKPLFSYLGLLHRDIHRYMYGGDLKEILQEYWIPVNIEPPTKQLIAVRNSDLDCNVVGVYDSDTKSVNGFNFQDFDSYKLLR